MDLSLGKDASDCRISACKGDVLIESSLIVTALSLNDYKMSGGIASASVALSFRTTEWR